jgi:hypothetical protein
MNLNLKKRNKYKHVAHSIPLMSLIIGSYVDEHRQGHVGIVFKDNKLLHCYGDSEISAEGLFMYWQFLEDKSSLVG